MRAVPFAFSVHHFVNSVGADAGFAAFIGLAILILLYFAQARETATLREHAYEAAQRIQQLEARVAELAARQPAQAPPAQAPAMQAGASQRTHVPAAAPQPSRSVPVPAGAAAAPVAPAGVGAPALTAATKLIPTVAAPTPQEPEPAPPELDEEESDLTSIAAPAPATAAAVGTNGSSRDRIPPPAAAGVPVQAPPRVQIRPGGPSPSGRRPAPPPRGPSQQSGGPPPRGFFVLLAALAVVAVIAVLLIATSGGGSSNSTNASKTTNAPATHRAKRKAAFNPSSVTVSVLNGTSTSGLAHRVALRLGASGYKQGTIATASDQTRTATVVAYLPGHRDAALHVATALKLGPAAVQQIDSSTQAVACPPPSPCAATVVVTVGADLASTA